MFLAFALPACGMDDFVHDVPPELDDRACQIDRTQECLLGDRSCQGYPGEGPNGWGYQKGNRLPNMVLYDCDGNERELAELLTAQDGPVCEDGYPGALMLDLGAYWCDSCAKESGQIVGSYPSWREQGAHVVNILVGIQNWEGGTEELCNAWPTLDSSDEGQPELPFPVWFADRDGAELLGELSELKVAGEDVDNGISAALPLRVFVDANANIRDISVGEVPDPPAEIDSRFAPLLADPLWQHRD